jgi:hypothetical protein
LHDFYSNDKDLDPNADENLASLSIFKNTVKSLFGNPNLLNKFAKLQSAKNIYFNLKQDRL